MQVIDIEAKEKNKEVTPEALPDLPTNVGKPLKTGLLVLLLGFGGFLAWSALAPIDSGVPANGAVTLDGRRKTVQHLSGGVVKSILVKEGDAVKEGDLLIRMDDAVPLAQRSIAESELRSVNIQIQFLEKLLSDLQSMTDEGFYPRNRYLETQKQLADAKARKAGLNDRVAAANQELQRTVVVSPASGNVMGVAITTEGGVIGPGGKLLDVVPDDERLVVEAQIQPHLIDKVVPGLMAEVRFSALNLRSTPVIEGKVEWVSPDRFLNQDPMYPAGYFTARLVVDAKELEKLGAGAQIRPGMPAEVIFKTGERTFLQYLVKPLSDRMARSLKEQ